ncbi:glycoside hydrolase family 2 TIM barrel-domain containing protein [Niabella yanshanensis]|uniref:Glycoside hydrolase family 2 TIM barrel-domain containing protein n=1 Tax=Niabella yanshanensis TaxID=577386 RepID=A0ABZ0W5W6_9BACT|nr:glycoside hydrolase family 2 TIM barrel-domain containing protein [Niabella yanshanensis]WQD38008.1 glycoside hydrolase family 2 TIM barrel-domain containing protein [Niabella yanshanensis]
MKRFTLSILVFLCIQSFSNCIAQAGGRERLLMDAGWKFSQTDTVGAEKAAFNDSRWRTLNLPHDWSIEHDFIQDAPTGGGGGYLPTGVGWYRKQFTIPRSALSKVVWIEFDGVYQNSDVWINGHHLGRYPNGYMSFHYDLTPHLKAGNNTITVRVDNSRQPNTRWYSGSGIYRHVWLNIAHPLHIAQWGTYITTPQVDAAKATVQIKTTVNNRKAVSGTATLRSVIVDEVGKEVGRTESAVSLKSGTDTTIVSHEIQVATPVLWSLEKPHMYSIWSLVIDKGKVIDEVATPFGIRHIEYDADKGFLLNGKRIKMKGVCLHHDAGSVGAAVPESMWVRRLQILKDMGCNAIRTSHNPMAPEFLDLCDRMGFLVQNEVYDVWLAGKAKYDYAVYFKEWSQRDLVNFIHRDRNHPSVVLWSAGNEIGEQGQPKGYEVLRPLIETFHREDPTRPVTTGNDHIADDNSPTTPEFLSMLDIVGYNYVDRWRDRRELFYDIDKRNNPGWKMIGTENVSISGVRGNYFGGGYGRIDSSVIQPANLPGVIRAEQLWKFTAVHDYVIGDFMWTGIDYLGEARWPSKNSSSGVIDLCGFPKDAYYFYKSQWTDQPMIHLAPHWNWNGREGKVIPVMAYTNCDTVELFLNGKSFGAKSVQFPRPGNAGAWNRYAVTPVGTTTADLHLIWDVPYEPGILKAVGRKGGKTIVEEEIRTTGAPAAFRLSVDRSKIEADATNVAHVKIEVVDKDGNIVPNAAESVQVIVEGAGRLIGLDNGNPVDHTSMKSDKRKTFNGLALAVVQPAIKPGTIRVTTRSSFLKNDSIEISTVKSGSAIRTLEQMQK